VQQAGSISYFRLWDLGIRLYAYTYFATDQFLRERKDVLVRYISASARGWLYARDHPDEVVEHLFKMTTGLDRKSELKTWEEIVRGGYLTSVTTKQHGWGYMDPKVWQELTETMRALGQIPRPVSVEEIMTDELVVSAKTPNV
jgi:NitT/TauT family transport system substrate-binding protein